MVQRVSLYPRCDTCNSIIYTDNKYKHECAKCEDTRIKKENQQPAFVRFLYWLRKHLT